MLTSGSQFAYLYALLSWLLGMLAFGRGGMSLATVKQ
jgi:hypothetical protein